jgi:hypothetical protein
MFDVPGLVRQRSYAMHFERRLSEASRYGPIRCSPNRSRRALDGLHTIHVIALLSEVRELFGVQLSSSRGTAEMSWQALR